MRRNALIASAALVALACGLLPAAALAHHHGREHHQHGRAHRARHHSHLIVIPGSGATPGSAGSTPGNAGATGQPQASTGNAGTVVSFTEGVLTVKLGEGASATTVSGKVDEETEIHCIQASPTMSTPPAASTAPAGQQGGWSGDGGQPGDRSGGGPGPGGGDDWNDGRDNGDRDGQGDCHQCSPANLTPGAIVHSAELRLDSSGAVFEEIVLAL